MHHEIEKLLAEENAGSIEQALARTYSLRQTHADSAGLADFLDINRKRLVAKAIRLSRKLDWSAEPLFEHAANPRKATFEDADEKCPPIVSLTTISERLPSCLEVVKSLANSVFEFHSINLYISEEPYLIDRGIGRQNSFLRQLHEAGANIYKVTNTGPYRKSVPLIFQLRESGADGNLRILTVDDDVHYPDDAWTRMLEESARLDCVIAHRGRRMEVREDQMSSYEYFSTPDGSPSFADLPTGRNGILYRLKHFGEGFEHFAGPILAPTADDLWAKCSTVIRGVPALILEPTAAEDIRRDYAEVFPEVKDGLWRNYNADKGNNQAFLALEAFYSELIEAPLSRLIETGSFVASENRANG